MNIRLLTVGIILTSSVQASGAPFGKTDYNHSNNATSWYGHAVTGIAFPDAGGGSDLSEALSIGIGVGWCVNHNLSFELALEQLVEAEDEGSDNVGEYTLTFDNTDVTAGIRYRFDRLGKITPFASLGWLYYNTEVTLEERFYGLRPSGEVDSTQTGTGYYFAGGIEITLNRQLSIVPEIQYAKRQDLFEGEVNGFDLESWRAGAVLIWSF